MNAASQSQALKGKNMHPFVVRKLIFPLHERLKGKSTYARLAEIEQSQWMAQEALLDLQFRRLKQHLEFAYREIPYYTRLLDAHALQPHRIDSLADFARVPFLTKDIIRKEFERLQPTRKRSRVQWMSTGGSTGAPVTILIDAERTAFTDACRMRAHRWYGVDVGSREIVLWGSPIELTKQDHVRMLRDRLMNSRLLSAFNMGEKSLAEYAKTVNDYRPEKLYGYASAIFLLAAYMKKTGRNLRVSPKAVFATAEPLFDFQRKTIEEVFQCPVSIEYGARDAGLIALECPSGGLHIAAEGMIVEIDRAGREGLGEIVITNLYSFAMPIIRYRTGDVGEFDDTPCPCGRLLPRLKRVEGRQTDFLVAEDGRLIHALAIIYVMREIPIVKEFQVTQESLRRLVIHVVAESSLPANERKTIERKAKHLLGHHVDVVIQEMSSIPVSPSGKFRYVISRVADSYLKNNGGFH
jgi:phenylacetate-CoA ligase